MSPSSSYLSAEYFRFRRRLGLGFFTVACLALIAGSWEIHSSFIERGNTAHIQAQALVHAIADQVTDSVQLVDYALMGFANDIKELPAEKRKSGPAIRQVLNSHDPASGEDFWVMFVDVGGLGVAASNNVPVQGVSYAEHDFFQARARMHAEQGLYTGEPSLEKMSRKRIFTLSRRVESASGEFLGLVVAVMDASRFAAKFERARFNENLSISLVQQGRKIIAQVPHFEQSFATTAHTSSDIGRQMREVPTYGFDRNSPVEARSKTSSASASGSRPLEVFVTFSASALNQALRHDLLVGAIGMLLLATVMLLSGYVALMSYRALDKSKQALEASESRSKFALEGAGEGVWDWNLITGETYFSPRWKQMLGYADEEIGNNADAWRALMHPDDQPLVAKRCEACKLGETPSFDSEHRMLCKDGSWKWILSRGMIVSRDAAGQTLRMIGTHADVSERKQTEQAQVHRIVDAAPDPMLLVGADGMITFANSAAQSTFGYPFEELIGQRVDNLVQFTSRGSHAFLHKKLETSLPPHSRNLKGPLTALHRDGTGFPVETSLSSFQMNGQSVVIAHIRDISDRKRAEELLHQSFTRVRRLSDHQENIKEYERKRIAQDIHDDLGQNLLALKMDVAALHSRTAEAHPKLNKRVAIVLKNINHTIQSVKSIMNDLRPATLELGLYPAVEWQVKQFERVSGIACRLSTVGPEAEFGLDESQTLAVFRILQESLANVVRHAWASSVEIVLNGNRRSFSMTVSDNGKGMQPGDRKKANSFGLIGVGERVHSFGGDFTITSSPGNGTLLSISIPVKEMATDAA